MPGKDTLEVVLIINNKSISKKIINYDIIEYSDFVASPDSIHQLFKTTTEYRIVNLGNIPKTDLFKVQTNIFEKLFISSEPNPTEVKLRQQYMGWELSLEPGEETTLIVTENYRPALYILLIIVVVTMVYFIYRSPVSIKKEAIVIGSSEEGISDMKILLHVRNRSPDLIESITLTDMVPALAQLKKQKHIGTLAPSKILRHKKKGTIVKWELEALEPFEERIISYVIKTKMTIVGGYNLPIAKMQFMAKNNTERVVKSNRSSVSLGL